MKNKKISEEEISYIIESYKKGLSCIEIGKLLHRDDSTIRRCLKNNGVYKNKINYISGIELDNIIKDYNNGMKPFELEQKYNRSSGSIINKLKSIGIYKDSRNNYTKEDEEFLTEHYKIGDWDSIFERFPNTTRQSIFAKMSNLGVKADYKNYWSKEEFDILKKYYFSIPIEELCKMMNYRHSKDAIETKALRKFGYSKDDSWTNSEEEILKKFYSITPLSNVCLLLPNRSQNAIINHAKKFNLKSFYTINTYWSDIDTEFLIDNWNKYSDEELARHLHKDKRSIKSKRSLLGLLRYEKDSRKYSSLNKYIRGQLSEWKKQSMISCKYQCIFTGSKEFQIHHTYPVNRILNDIFKKYNIQDKNFQEYSQNELDYILELFLEEQDKHPLGVCVRKDIHDLYHTIYGKTTNNENQWNQFVKEYREGIYSDIA